MSDIIKSFPFVTFWPVFEEYFTQYLFSIYAHVLIIDV